MKLWPFVKNKGRRTAAANRPRRKFGKGSSQLFNFERDSYLERTSRPVYAVIFLLPFIVFYELGTFSINTDVLNQSQIRVVTFVWLQHFLESLGFGGKFAWVAPPLAVIVILLSLQITSGKKWYFWVGDVFPMLVECVLLAVPLIVLALFLNSAPMRGDVSRIDNSEFQNRCESFVYCSSVQDNNSPAANGNVKRNGSNHPLLADIVTGIGAGIYEELVFRLILICVLIMLFQDVLKFGHENAVTVSILISAALFSAHHHIDFFSGQPMDPFNWTRFSFRTIAGVYFAILYAIRGFGITAGTHAFYNIMAVPITAIFFTK